MIDVTYFQNLLLLVCVLAFVAAVFSGAVVESRTRWLHVLIKLFFAVLGVSSGMAVVLLLLLK